MTAEVTMEFCRRPSALAYMLRGLHPSLGERVTGSAPSIGARWRSQLGGGYAYDS
jgi:hypothetical protein